MRCGTSVRAERLQHGLPYCAAVWKYGFARSRGDARLCPYADVGTGPVESVMAGAYNAALLSELRSSMRAGEPCLSVCRGCTDDHRRFRIDSLKSACHSESSAAVPVPP